MTEEVWLQGKEPLLMHDCLKEKGSDRKLRLMAVACCHICRRVRPGGKCHPDCEVVVDFVDGTGTMDAVRSRWGGGSGGTGSWPERPFEWSREFVTTALTARKLRETRLSRWPTDVQVIALMRDIFGNPFRPPEFSESWRTDTAVALARQMYDGREFSAMPILADALQDAGCDNEEMLRHCRNAKQKHVRGCWVVDLVLGRE